MTYLVNVDGNKSKGFLGLSQKTGESLYLMKSKIF